MQKRHTPTLNNLEEVHEEETLHTSYPTPGRRHTPANASSTNSLGNSSRQRFKVKATNVGAVGFSPSPGPSGSSYTFKSGASSGPRYSDIYGQFIRKYRSGASGDDDYYRTDQDGQHTQPSLGGFLDGSTSDEEETLRPVIHPTQDERHASIVLDQNIDPATAEERERLEWQTMLASVLDGDVLKSEKSRIVLALESSADERHRHVDVWLGFRAKLRRVPESQEKKKIEERRIHLVDHLVNDILSFRVDTESKAPPPPSPARQVETILRRLDSVQDLYPTLKALYEDKPMFLDPNFQRRRDALITWSNVHTTLKRQIYTLNKWTGSETLDVTQPHTNAEVPISLDPQRRRVPADDSTFVERVLKEDSLQRTFEKSSLQTMHSIVVSTRAAHVALADVFEALNLPTFEKELVMLISFPTKLVEASLRVRLDYATKVMDPELLIIDQMLEDFRLSIGLACTIRRQYNELMEPDPAGHWKLPPCISSEFDTVILEALEFLFKLLRWKLKIGAKAISFKDTELIESYWGLFNEVSVTTVGGSALVAEHLSALTNNLIARMTNTLETQIQAPSSHRKSTTTTRRAQSRQSLNGMHDTDDEPSSTEVSSMRRSQEDERNVQWYGKVLDGLRMRYRKLQRFARALTQRFSNSAEYSLEGVDTDAFINQLVTSDHFLIYTQTFEEEGTYIIAHRSLKDRPDIIRKVFKRSFHVDEIWQSEYKSATLRDQPEEVESGEDGEEEEESEENEAGYILLLSPTERFLWHGLVLMLELPKIDFELKEKRIRLIADGAQSRLALAKQTFMELFSYDDDTTDEDVTPVDPPQCLIEQQAHLPKVNREVRRIPRMANRLAHTIVLSIQQVQKELKGVYNCQELLETWFSYCAEHGQHAEKYMDNALLGQFHPALTHLAISWVAFICDDCDPTDRKTFRWAVNALEFALLRTTRNNILRLEGNQFDLLRQKVASCMTLLISHFDILGARSNIEAKREKERLEELQKQSALASTSFEDEDEFPSRPHSPDENNIGSLSGYYVSMTDRSLWQHREEALSALEELDARRAAIEAEQHMVGRVMDNEKPEDRSLSFLASASNNISLRWQQGRFIGAGAFGSVYQAINMDTGSLMAVKEIRFQDVAGISNLFKQIMDELKVMEMLHHPNVVEYYGIEVHRDKVYIFEEYCQGGSLASLLELGRIEDEGIIQVYTMQMLEGLAYLHSQGIVHRDIKPDNILLDHMGVIKYVDFGASKILAKNQKTMQKTRIGNSINMNAAAGTPSGLAMNNSLTGTPMYMAPEVIKNDNRGRHGAMDIWSLGCVVLEFATGRKPWSNLDNEWAIMFQIGIATKHPPLPEPGQLSPAGIDFIRRCLIIDPGQRPSAVELMEHHWMVVFREAMDEYEEQELPNTSNHVEQEQVYEGATVARQAAILREQEHAAAKGPSPPLDVITPPTE
ncbi:hypothetical protein SISNIDRAFT_549623 [Sistotremastrum niveocremeum HHB9708]|uniref:Protein kinase domain-containing protein n=1 Tax=Sistotremastrum niveocremeum HHB9708 TaxID=1314777 RepID=A0A164UH69_9AGAM|nr:hypothetical protein SISNIDRAFT_549623 [Sistotremastrum niveocremeum HHB9708]